MATPKVKFVGTRTENEKGISLDVLAFTGEPGKPTAEVRFHFAGSEEDGWAEGEMGVSATGREDYKVVSRLVRRLIGGKNGLGRNGTPDAITPAFLGLRFKRLRATQMVEDPRVGGDLVAVAGLEPEGIVFHDDPTGTDREEPAVGVMAENREDARMEIVHKLADEQMFDYLAEWIAQGRAVTEEDRGEAPDATPFAEMIRLGDEDEDESEDESE